MSSLNLRLDWNEEFDENGQQRGDRFDSRLAAASNTNVNATQEVQEYEDLEEEDWPEEGLEEFDYSENRVQALEAALGKIQGVVGAPILRYLSSLATDYGFISPEDFKGRCNAAQVWIDQQLADWQRTGRVAAEDDSEEALERAGNFNYALSVGSDALNLCSEILQLLRAGQAPLALKLLDQVESFFNQCREALMSVSV